MADLKAHAPKRTFAETLAELAEEQQKREPHDLFLITGSTLLVGQAALIVSAFAERESERHPMALLMGVKVVQALHRFQPTVQPQRPPQQHALARTVVWRFLLAHLVVMAELQAAPSPSNLAGVSWLGSLLNSTIADLVQTANRVGAQIPQNPLTFESMLEINAPKRQRVDLAGHGSSEVKEERPPPPLCTMRVAQLLHQIMRDQEHQEANPCSRAALIAGALQKRINKTLQRHGAEIANVLGPWPFTPETSGLHIMLSSA